MYNDDWSQLRNAAHLSTQHGLKFKVVRVTVPRSWAACPSQRVNILRYSMFCHFISFLDEFDKNESGISEGNCGRIGPISGLEMASVSIKSSLTFTGDSWLHLSRVGMFQDLGTSLRLDVIVRPSGLIAKTSKKMSQAEMIIFKCLLPVWTPGPRVVQHGPRALSLCSSHHSALDFINTLFNLASSQCKPKYSMELAVSASTGSGLSCACVCVCVWVSVWAQFFLGRGVSGSTSFSWTRKLWIMLALPGRTQREPGRAGWTLAGCLSRSLASRWHQAGGERRSCLTLAETGHALPLLTRLARCRRFPVLGSVFSLGCGCGSHW